MFRITKKNAIKLSAKDEVKFTSMHHFLEVFFQTHLPNSNYYGMRSLETVYVETEEQQCASVKLRSIRDIAMLMKYYFPENSYSDIMKEILLFTYQFDDCIYGITLRYCSDIQSPNLQFTSTPRYIRYENIYAIRTLNDTYTLGYKGRASYNWEKVLKEIGWTVDDYKEKLIDIYKKLRDEEK